VNEDVSVAKRIVDSSRRIVVLSGAGISTESGIPDFRGPNGLWTRNPEAEKLSTLDYYMSDPEVRRRAWRNRLESPTWAAEPNAGHRSLVELEKRGTLELIATQNIDGLHQAAGSDPDLVVELHGTMREVKCMTCGKRSPMDGALDRVRAGEDDLHCLEPDVQGGSGSAVCGGILKSATISFGESLVADDLRRAETAAASCDLLLAVGSSLSVYPAAGMVPIAYRAGANVVIVNAEPTEYDSIASAVLRGTIGEVLPRALGVSG